MRARISAHGREVEIDTGSVEVPPSELLVAVQVAWESMGERSGPERLGAATAAASSERAPIGFVYTDLRRGGQLAPVRASTEEQP